MLMKEFIVTECKKYDYFLDNEIIENDKIKLSFKNDNQIEELKQFNVIIDYALELVSMALIIDLDSWNYAIDSNINNINDIIENIHSWLCKENLEEVAKDFLN